MNNRPKILVVGSLVMDLTVGMERFPMTGETVLGTFFKTAAGGKGANQAVQAARLGADVTMVGKVGDDDFGKQLIQAVSESGVDITRIKTSKNFCTAIGNIQIENRNGKADNRICVVPGAQYAAAQLIYNSQECGITPEQYVMRIRAEHLVNCAKTKNEEKQYGNSYNDDNLLQKRWQY